MNQHSDRYVEKLFAKIAPDGTRVPDEFHDTDAANQTSKKTGRPATRTHVLHTVQNFRVRNPQPNTIRIQAKGDNFRAVDMYVTHSQARALITAIATRLEQDRQQIHDRDDQ